MLTTAKDVITKLGGLQKVATLTKRRETAVAKWRERNRFPCCTYKLLRKTLEAAGESADPKLWPMDE